MSKPQIMVVEDEGLVALEIKEGLENMGYLVPAVASSGEEALLKAQELRPDLVLMDIMLDGTIDGIQAAEKMKDNFSIPVIYLTSHSDENTLERAKLTGSYGYVLKPFEDRALKAAIEIALHKAEEEKKLLGNKKWFSIILRCLQEGVIVADIKGALKFINDAASQVVGWDQHEIAGTQLQEIFPVYNKETGESFPLALTKPIFEGKVIDEKNRELATREGKRVTIDYTIAPLRNDNSVIIGIIIVFKAKGQGEISGVNSEEILQKELEKPVIAQRNLLPKKGVVINGVKMDWLFYPSPLGSGDLFNFFPLDEKNVGFYLFDVVGHGFSAAIIAMTLHRLLLPQSNKGGILKRLRNEDNKTYMRRKTDFLPEILPPSQVIQELNSRFYFEENNNPFFTMIYGVINVETNTGRVARAGHLPPILHSITDEMSRLESQGYAIGIFPKIEISEHVFDFNKGDRLYLYSDGLIETTNRYMNQFANDRLITILKENRGKPIAFLVENLDKKLLSWRNTKQFDDDVAFMVLERQ